MKKIFPIKSEKGATAIEYALLAALISLACVTGIAVIGVNIQERLDYINAQYASQ